MQLMSQQHAPHHFLNMHLERGQVAVAVHVGGLGADVDHDALRLHRLAQDCGRQQPPQVQPVALHLAERQACIYWVRLRSTFRVAGGRNPRRYSRLRSTSLNARPA